MGEERIRESSGLLSASYQQLFWAGEGWSFVLCVCGNVTSD